MDPTRSGFLLIRLLLTAPRINIMPYAASYIILFSVSHFVLVVWLILA